MRLSTFLAVLASSIAAVPAAAQVRHAGVPAGLTESLSSPTRHVLAPVDVARHLAEDEARGNWPLRYGTPVRAGRDLLAEGTWDVARDGSLVVRLEVESRGAHTLGLEFDAFLLPRGAQLFLYDDARTNVFGAYTSENHRDDGGFVIEPFPGERVIVELRLPQGVEGDTRVVIGDVIHDYRDVRKFLVNDGSAADGCLLPVNCPQGNAWGLQKRATMRTLSGGGLCSAALINNTANDGTRYVLTANHCEQSANTIFTFNYQHSGCGTGPTPTNQTVSGATLLVTNSTVDSRLMRINGIIPASYGPVFAGWSRQTQNSTYGVAMGHPSGGPKMISIDNNGSNIETNMWRMTWHEGNLQGGSSGGPLFDQNGRIRGPACCVSSFTCNQTAWFGRFDRFWTIGGLAQWLDPIGANPITLDAFDPSGVPGGSAPKIDSVVPPAVFAVYADTLASVSLFGENLAEVHTVEIDGVPLGGFQYSVVGAQQVNISVPRQLKLGTVEVRVSSPTGTSAAQLLIEANPTPVIDVLPSDPLPLTTPVGAFITVGSQPGDIILLFASYSDAPSFLPGIIDAAIGDNFFALFHLGTHLTDAVKGWDQFHLPLWGLKAGLRLHFQAAKFPGDFPLEMSNVQSGTVLF